MPDEYRETLLKIIYALASTEFASVEQHQRWINQGPTPEDRYVQCQIAADEALRRIGDGERPEIVYLEWLRAHGARGGGG